MHPLFDNLKSLSFEELEKRSAEIHKRMQMYNRNQMNNPLIWDQLTQMQDAIYAEKVERAQKLNREVTDPASHVVINTDPLPDDAPTKAAPATNNKFNPIS
jgi:hypothetical protein